MRARICTLAFLVFVMMFGSWALAETGPPNPQVGERSINSIVSVVMGRQAMGWVLTLAV